MRFVHGLAALVAFVLPAAAYAQNYTYSNVIDSTSPYNTFGPGRINNVGQVSFSANRDAGANGIFRQDGAVTTTIADSTGFFSFFGDQTDINDFGQVAYNGSLSIYSAVLVGSGGAPTTIVDNTGHLNAFGALRLNNNGTVAFEATDDADDISHLYAGSGATPNLIAAGGAFGFSGVYFPDINDSGLVSFGRVTVIPGIGFPPPPPTLVDQSVETGNGATGAIIANHAGPFDTFAIQTAPINNAGHVAFVGNPDGGGTQLVLFDGSSLLTVADTTDGLFSDLTTTELNNADAVAFMATLTAGGTEGIFAGADPITDGVVLEGQSLFGSTVLSVDLGGINDLGQIVFNYSLADGRTGIAVAAPIPEPAMALLLAAALPLVSRRRR